MFPNAATQANRYRTCEVKFINGITSIANLNIVFTHLMNGVSPRSSIYILRSASPHKINVPEEKSTITLKSETT